MKFIILTGPTGTGKTSASLALAKILDTEIISADSMQIYKYMDIGTDKITRDQAGSFKHHMIDVVEPDEEFTVEDFRVAAKKIINELNAKGKIPLIVGGTGLYIDSLIYDLDFTVAPPNDNIRKYYDNLAESKGNDFLHKILQGVDPISAEKNHPNQRQRIIRALEVYDYTGKPFSSFSTGKKYLENVEFRYLVLNRNRRSLYEKINLRVDQMMENGLVDEVKALRDMGYSKGLKSMKAIGYEELLEYLDGGLSLDQAVDLIKRNSRRYAKRQLTWFRKEKSAIEIFIEEDESKEKIVKKCLRAIEGYDDNQGQQI